MVAIVVILLSGAKVFAAANPKSQFGEWYYGKFEPIEKSIAETVETEGLSVQESINKYVDELFKKIKDLLNPSSTIFTTEEVINSQKNRYKTKIEEVKDHLNTNDFMTYEDNEKEKIDAEIEKDIEQFLEDYLSK